MCIVMYYWYDVINANKMIHNELVLLVCFLAVDDMNLLNMKQSNSIHYKKSMQFHIFINELQYQYLNCITRIPVVYRVRIDLLPPMLNHFSLLLLKWRLCTSFLSYCLRVFHVLITFSRYDFSFDHVFCVHLTF